MGGASATEQWVLDNFAADPWTALLMVHTAEAVAREGAMSSLRGLRSIVELVHARRESHGQRLAVIENEFGAAGVDGESSLPSLQTGAPE